MRQIVLKSNTFLWVKGGDGVLYNTDTNLGLHFNVSDPLVVKVCKQWSEIDNLYSACFEENNASETFLSFVNDIENNGFGRVFDGDESVISFPPLLNIRDSSTRLLYKANGVSNKPVHQYLLRLRLFLGGPADKRPWWIQTEYPMDSAERLNPERVLEFLHRCNLNSLGHIGLMISDWDDSQTAAFSEILSILNLKDKACFYFSHPDPSFRNQVLEKLSDSCYAVTQVCPPDAGLASAEWVPGRNYHLLVRSEEEYNHWMVLLDHAQMENYAFKPIAENNLDFFRANVFLSEEDIMGQKLSKRDIFRHQALNMNNFGTFYIFPDGTIHSATTAPAIGVLENPVRQIIMRELEENHSWRQTRRLQEPCNNCIYHDMCPCPSVYERIFGKPGCTYWKG